jgi:prepilin-type N-terminal cleavage/methylation domain-containing protein
MEQKSSTFRRFEGTRRGSFEQGFTLVEVLIVISIIAILASMSFAGIRVVQTKTKMAQTRTEVSQFVQAIDRYQTDEKIYPGIEKEKLTDEDNQFPLLYDRLLGDPKPRGPGGRSSPYLKLSNERIVVEDPDWDELNEDTRWRVATRDERSDPKEKKYYVDAWRNAFRYRCNRGRKSQPWMLNPRSYDFYSFGPDGEDGTVLGEDAEEEENDDVSNS